MSTRQPPILIVGGGIGGLATALSLARRGRTVQLLERAAEFAEVGAGVQLAPNATRMLDKLGLLKPLMKVGVAPRRLVLADAIDGMELTSLDLTDFPERFGGPYLVAHRNDLLTLLLDACRAEGVELLTNAAVVKIVECKSGVTVITDDGREFEADVVIGADGLTSKVRAHFSDDSPICSGYVAYRGMIPMDQAARHADLRDVVAWLGPGMHLVQYPLRSGTMYNQVAVFRSAAWERGDPDWGNPGELDEVFSGCSDHVRESITTLGRESRWPMYDRLPIPTWTSNRVGLLGDAAHPMLQYLAQGACQALVDADVLSEALSLGASPEAALTRYQTIRAPATAQVQSTARIWGEIWHADGLTRTLRNELLADRDPQDFKHIDWLYGATG